MTQRTSAVLRVFVGSVVAVAIGCSGDNGAVASTRASDWTTWGERVSGCLTPLISLALTRGRSRAAVSLPALTSCSFLVIRLVQRDTISPRPTYPGIAVEANMVFESSARLVEVLNVPGCYVWTNAFRRGQIVTWTGECSANRPRGPGTLTWSWAPELVEEVEFVDGRRHGHAVHRLWDGSIDQGSYVAGKRDGQWKYRFPNGDLIYALFEHGELVRP